MAACTLTIQSPGGTRVLSFTPPVSLYRLLADNGVPVDMPCGGRQRCLKCKTAVTGGVSPMSEREAALLSAEEKAAGIRFACMAELTGNAVLHLSGGAAGDAILTEGIRPVFALAPWGREWGAAVDIGTTTVAAYLYRLADGALLATRSEKNPQAVFGADVVSRLEQAMNGKAPELAAAIRGCLSRLLTGLCEQAGLSPDAIDSVVLTGNTAMLYLLTERHPASIVAAPFAMDCGFGQFIAPQALALPLSPDCRIYLPACLSAYVGADITTALLAADFFRAGQVPAGPPRLLVDIGTNGEMALAADGRLLCCSTAAGPALEGAGIHQGMMARTGAIYRVRLEGLTMTCDVLGGGEAQGICGSGLVDAVAALCEAGVLLDTGLIDEENHAFTAYIEDWEGQPAFRLPGTAVRLTQKDIRAVQLAKSAICAGMRTLLAEARIQPEAVAELVVAGGFGSRIDPVSAERIGLFPTGFAAKARAVGNAAGAGAAMVLLSDPIRREAEGMPAAVRTVELSSHPGFMDAYIDGMIFA